MKKRVLIIENDDDIRGIVSYILEAEGYDVVTAKPWPVEQLARLKADLILLDEWVNKKAGHELCTELKKMHATMHIPVILLSTSPNIQQIAEGCKADGFVNKPFNLDDLVDEVKKCLRQGSGHLA